MIFYDDFLGSDISNKTVEFIGGDWDYDYNDNLKKQPEDWYYRTHKVTYQFNEWGHRSKSIKDIDLDNYMLFTGCSHTTGVGLELEKTYPYLVSKMLGCDYYNLSMPAIGIDLLEYNLLTWYTKISKKPKYVVIQWPDHSRFASYLPEYKHMLERGSWSDDPVDISLTVNGEDTGMFYARKELSRRLLEFAIPTEKFYYDYGSQSAYGHQNNFMRMIDKARDLAHGGILSNEKFALQVYSNIKSRTGSINI